MTSTITASSQQGGSTWVQTGPLDFGSHPLTGADNAYEQISEVPALKIPYPGVWEISYHARSSTTVNATGSQWVHTALFKNGGLIPGSEALAGLYGTNAAIQSTAGQTFMEPFVAGDVVTLHAYRIGQAGSAAVIGQTDGRTGVMAHWVSPGS
jgi:hypothetical protein